MMQGLQELYVQSEFYQIRYQKCEKKQKADEKRHQQTLIKSLYVPKEILTATFDQLDQDNRTRIVAIAKNN
ncbi:hypothetical protein KHA80_16515 [Anaerobacillus sp. HL2]|nr:hypothetical protein KHA80_16515 [Anaerobacillus sp. HL2]